MNPASCPYEVQVVTDPAELARATERDEQFRQNLLWWQANAVRIGREQRGRCIAIAKRELFVADNPEEAIAKARAAHPEDQGLLVLSVPSHSFPRIYAH